jgi:DNA-directed RNA polymerase specialized sigma24 family protein
MDNEDTLWEIIQHSDMSSVRKEALLLKFRDGLSIKAIMNELTISESAAKMRIDRGKKDLKKTLTALMEENH